MALVKRDGDVLGRDRHVVAPRRHAHDRLHDHDALVQVLEILGFVGGAEDVGVGGIGLLRAHLVAEPGPLHVFRHLLAAAQLVDERLIEPGLVDAQRGVGQQAVAVEPLDVVALERAAVTPDVHVVLAHRLHQHRAGDRAANGGGVEVGDAGGGDVEGAALEGCQALGHELWPAVHQPRLFSTVGERLAGDLVVVGLVGLAQVGRVGVGASALGAHPVQRGAGVEPAGERDADAFAGRDALKNRGH